MRLRADILIAISEKYPYYSTFAVEAQLYFFGLVGL